MSYFRTDSVDEVLSDFNKAITRLLDISTENTDKAAASLQRSKYFAAKSSEQKEEAHRAARVAEKVKALIS